MDVAIRVEQLSKKYRIGLARHDTLRERLSHALHAPGRWLGRGAAPSPSDFWALRDVSFEVKRGEVVGVIGRNGAGKSTLLKILSRITDPTAGRASLHGRVASLLEVGTGFHPELTGRENIFLNGAILGMQRAEVRRKFDEIVAFADVDRFLDTPVKHYSSGMYVRLAFAVAAHLQPEILIVDEVLAVGDAQFQRKCLGKISQVASTLGRTVLFVSHNMNAVRSLCHRAIWLQGGAVREIGPVDACTTRYLAESAGERTAELDGTTYAGERSGDGRARIRRIRLTNVAGVPQTQFLVGEEFLLQLELEVKQPLTSYLVGFHVANQEQQIIVCSNHHDSLPSETLPAGRHTFRCRVADVALAPGAYALSFAVSSSSGAGVSHDALPDALRFEVQPALHEPHGKNRHLLDGRPGLVRRAMAWECRTG